MYVDDISILLKNKSSKDLEIDCFFLSTNLYQYFNSKNLHVNPTKPNCLHFKNSRNFEYSLIIMNEFELQFQSVCKYLEMI